MRGKLLLLGVVIAAAAVAGLASLRAQEAREMPQEAPPVVEVIGGGYLGVYLEEVDGGAVDRLNLPEESGALVAEVVEDSPAAAGGLEKGDVIVGFNGEPVESIAKLGRLVRETPAGRSVSLDVIREGQTRRLTVEIGERPDVISIGPDIDRDYTIRVAPGHGEHRVFAFGGRGRLGVQLQALSDQLADYFGVSEGALIASVRDDSPASAAGLQAGDVITRVGDSDVRDPGDVIEEVHEADEGPLTITIVRGGDTRTVTVDLPERHSRSWGWDFGDESRFSFVIPDISLPEIVVPEIRTPSIVVPEIRIPSFEIDGDGEPWIVIPEITIPEIDIPEVVVPEFRVPEMDIPGREITVQGPVQIV